MSKVTVGNSVPARALLGVIVLLMVTEPVWAVLGVWRRTAVRTAVIATSVSAANANAAASANEAASAAAAQQSAAASAAAHPQKSPQQQLQELKSLYDQGLISASDYQAAKQKVLNQMTQ